MIYSSLRTRLLVTLSNYDPSLKNLDDHNLFGYLMNGNDGDYYATSVVINNIDQAFTLWEGLQNTNVYGYMWISFI